ncbi:T9SS type A sorting domain-containing protein [candidate division WOR-3 bacterium]|nr:T9SS type A sorting domain-containing protein [candidate division WOR-3 bacterium]
MFYTSIITLIISSGILVEPFRIAEAEPGHHQVMVRAVMAPDGRFAVAWIDSLVNLAASPDFADFEMYVRFFEEDGNPLTEARKITKVADTNRIYWPDLAMDSAGNTVLLWAETRNRWGEDGHIRIKLFDRDGITLDSSYTVDDAAVYPNDRTVALSRNSQGEFAVAWACGMGVIWVQRYAAEGAPLGEPFLVHGEFETDYMLPGVALNDEGDLLVTWLNFGISRETYPKFQVFDAQNSSILPWEPEGRRLDDGGPYDGSRSEAHWLDENRFVTFWGDMFAGWLVGRVFSDKGLTRHPVCDLYEDGYRKDSLSVSSQWGASHGWFSSALRSDGHFALSHTRSYVILNDSSFDAWYHQVGGLGAIEDNEPRMQTALFEYSPPYGADTAGKDFNFNVQPPAVAACDNQLVWVYSRFNPDTIFEAWAVITDWDMVGVKEALPAFHPHIKLETSLNRLSYDVPGEAKLILYNSAGRRVAEAVIHDKGEWTAVDIPSGVYFAVIETGSESVSEKVVIIR